MEKYNIEITGLEKSAILAGLEILQQTLCADNPHPENEFGIKNTNAICDAIRSKLN